eukprot:COSAG01_NODE_59828_length_298_cov_0.613065_1_plen_28_part_10
MIPLADSCECAPGFYDAAATVFDGGCHK